MATFWLVQPFWNGSLGPCLFVDEYLPFFAFFLKRASRFFLTFLGVAFVIFRPWIPIFEVWTAWSIGMCARMKLSSLLACNSAEICWATDSSSKAHHLFWQIWDNKCIKIFLNFQIRNLVVFFILKVAGQGLLLIWRLHLQLEWRVPRFTRMKNYTELWHPKKNPAGFLDVFFSNDELFRIVLRKQHQRENPGWFCWKHCHDNSLDPLVMRIFFSGRAKRWSSSAAVISLISRRKSSRRAPAPHDWEFIGKCDGQTLKEFRKVMN